MNADGSHPTNLTNFPGAYEVEPDWSPDGTKLAFRSTRDGGGIYVMNANGSGQSNLSNRPNTPGLDEDFEPAWSPDGTKLAFTSTRDGNDEIYVMNADGSGQTNLTANPARDGLPVSWSPDGTHLVFTSDRDAGPGHTQLYIMNADGTGQTNLINGPGSNYYPAWSPDGRIFAFTSDRDGAPGFEEIYVMNADGLAQTNVSNDAGSRDFDPAWQAIPVTQQYAFTGFFAPLDNAPTVNVAKAGRGIPVKFSLGGNRGLDIFTSGFPKFISEPCSTSDPLDQIEFTTSSPGGLTYDPTTEQYTYVWKTTASLGGRCGRFTLGLNDGSNHDAEFRFTR